ncbi:unnamed protein product [Arabidopsis halleri]
MMTKPTKEEASALFFYLFLFFGQNLSLNIYAKKLYTYIFPSWRLTL